MKSFFLGCVAATTLAIAAAAAADTSTPAAGDKAADATTPSEVFIDKQDVGLVRAPKLVGVAVYEFEQQECRQDRRHSARPQW